MIEKFMQYCKTSKSYVYKKAFSLYELLLKVIEKLNEVIDIVNGFDEELTKKEDSDNITNNRKLSENGDFTGTLCNGAKTACQVVNEIDSNTGQISFLTNQFEDGATGLVVDGGFFTDDDINKNYDGGVW